MGNNRTDTLRTDTPSALLRDNDWRTMMRTGTTFAGALLVAGAVVLLAMPAMAGNGKGKAYRQGGGSGKGVQQRLRDRSCQGIEEGVDILLTSGKQSRSGDRDGTPDRDRRRDGSCEQAIEWDTLLLNELS